MTPPPIGSPTLDPQRPPPAPFSAARIGLTVLALLGVSAIVYVASNVAVGLLLGVVLAFVVAPLWRRVTRLLGGRSRAAAFVTTTLVTVLTLASAVGAVWIVASEAVAVAREVQLRAATMPLDKLIGRGGVWLLDAFHVPRPWLLTQVREGASHLQALAAPVLTGVVTSTGAGLITGVITFATMYYGLFQWEDAARRIETFLPLRPRHTRILLEEFQSVGRSALVSTLGTAVIQGLLATAGYAIAGLPRAALWGLITALLAFLPVGGTMLVWAPASLYLLSVNRNAAAVTLCTWSLLVVVMLSDYVIRPRLVGRTSPVHPLFVLVALLGGVESFGLWGVLIGPVVMSVCIAALRLYESEFAPSRRRRTLP